MESAINSGFEACIILDMPLYISESIRIIFRFGYNIRLFVTVLRIHIWVHVSIDVFFAFAKIHAVVADSLFVLCVRVVSSTLQCESNIFKHALVSLHIRVDAFVITLFSTPVATHRWCPTHRWSSYSCLFLLLWRICRFMVATSKTHARRYRLFLKVWNLVWNWFGVVAVIVLLQFVDGVFVLRGVVFSLFILFFFFSRVIIVV